jgi:molecular chaperone HtpG
MNSPIDNHFIAHLEQTLEKTALKRVDGDVMDKLIAKDEPIASVLSEEQVSKVKEIFSKAITRPGMEVTVESLSPDELPVSVTMDEWMRRMKEMAAMGGGGMSFYGALPDRYKVAVNSNHPLITRMLEADSEDGQTRLARQAFDLALLSQGMLTGPELTEFVQRSVALI